MLRSPAALIRRLPHGKRLARLVLFAIKPLLLLSLAVGGFVLFCQWLVLRAGAGRLYTNVADVPVRDVGLVLGVGERLGNGSENPFFKYRIAAAAELFKAGKVRRLLVSGDNHTRGYDEPAMMTRALMNAGVPESAIHVDDAGFRTLDSIVRARKVFLLERFTIISQKFHNQRALLIAGHHGIDAIGFCAPDVGFRYSKWTYVREALARVKVVLDLYVFHTGPKFLGPPIRLSEGA